MTAAVSAKVGELLGAEMDDLRTLAQDCVVAGAQVALQAEELGVRHIEERQQPSEHDRAIAVVLVLGTSGPGEADASALPRRQPFCPPRHPFARRQDGEAAR